MRRLRFAVQPSWLALHAVTVVLIVTMILLGRWQLSVSEHKGFSVQNFGYALQWWAFSGFVLVMWARAMRDAYRKYGNVTSEVSAVQVVRPRTIDTHTTASVAYRRYVVPTTTKPADDPVHLAYNEWLARIAADDASPEDAR